MTKLILPILLIITVTSCAQQNNSTGGGILKKAGSIFGKSKGGGGLSNEDIVAGLKEALSVGAQNSASKLSAVDGCRRRDQGIDATGSEESRIYLAQCGPWQYGRQCVTIDEPRSRRRVQISRSDICECDQDDEHPGCCGHSQGK